jgi:hypothetical protein
MLPTQWRCRFCQTWNKWAHRYCNRCLAQKSHMTLTEDDTR